MGQRCAGHFCCLTSSYFVRKRLTSSALRIISILRLLPEAVTTAERRAATNLGFRVGCVAERGLLIRRGSWQGLQTRQGNLLTLCC